MDAVTGQILYQKDADLPLHPASTTKILTAIVALENQKSEKDLLRVSNTATRVPSSKLRLRPGQAMSFRDLLYALLLSSANDASLVLAEGIAGSVKGFAERMNFKAREIGAMNSHFTNPHGLTAAEHYSTARDMAVIFNYAMRNPLFRDIVGTKTISVLSLPAGRAKRARTISLRNHNRLLWRFDGAIGGKTGYTHAAQKCFVGSASRDGVTLIVSILGSRYLWRDTISLLEYGFDHYESLNPASTEVTPNPPNGPAWPEENPSSHPPFWEEEWKLREDGGYILQVASFSEKNRAESLHKGITDAGFQAYLEESSLATGETVYRVRVGPYSHLTHAQEAAGEIESKSGFQAIIIPVQPNP